MSYDVFISYSSKDRIVADAACAILENNGIKIWMAPRNILAGEDWGQSIIGAINNARAMILIFSGNANSSKQVPLEIERAINKGIPIIPFRIENVPPTGSLELFISASHWLDAFTRPLEAALIELATSVKALLRIEAPAIANPQVHELRNPTERDDATGAHESASKTPQTHPERIEAHATGDLRADTARLEVRIGTFVMIAAALAAAIGLTWLVLSYTMTFSVHEIKHFTNEATPVAPQLAAPRSEPVPSDQHLSNTGEANAIESSPSPEKGPAKPPPIARPSPTANERSVSSIIQPGLESVPPKRTPRARPVAPAARLNSKKCVTFNGEKFCE